jgi:ethanolamine utilization protein EutJ
MAQRLRRRRGLSGVRGPHELLAAAAEIMGRPPERTPARPRVGVDLGTASCVLVVLDGDDPVWVSAAGSGALHDGVVVDFAMAVATVRELRDRAQEALGTDLTSAATAYPPCIPVADARACTYVCETAGFDTVTLVDEVSAAQRTLGITDGVVVDVGGGSTGVGVFRGGVLERLDDRPGGGHHLDLVLAGALGVDVADAERIKRERPAEALPIVTPGLQRIAESVRVMTRGTGEDLPLHLAGGALMLPGAGDVLARYLRRTVVTHPHALLITPLGIARSLA